MNVEILNEIQALLSMVHELKITIVEHYGEYQYYIIDCKKDKMIYSSIDDNIYFDTEDKCIYNAINWIILNVPSTGK